MSLGFGFPWPGRFPGISTPRAGLEKLGFPWILSSEMSLFNGLRENFVQKFFSTPNRSRAPENERKRRPPLV
jgi:hypothetical protein